MLWVEFKAAVEKYIKEEELGKDVEIEFIDTDGKDIKDLHIYNSGVRTICIY